MKRFPRTSMFHGAGADMPDILIGRVIGVNTVNYTVDVQSRFDRRKFFDVQIASPYLHYVNGEGLSCLPDLGAVCVVCLPSDTSPPFVLCFLMPHETSNRQSAEAPNGTRPRAGNNQAPVDASFAGGRNRAKPGDITLKTRDDNFLILHRGGVLQIGATPLAQRIFLPLHNSVLDFSENYSHANSGGTVSWGIQNLETQTDLATQFRQCFRLFADDKFGDVRVSVGSVDKPVPEPTGSKGEVTDVEELKIGKDDPIVFEAVFGKNMFKPDNGALATPGARESSVIRLIFDRAGRILLRAQADSLLSFKKKLRLKVGEDLQVRVVRDIQVEAGGDLTMQAGGSLTLNGAVVRIGRGSIPVAGQGDIVQVSLPFTPMQAAPTPMVVTGQILSGNGKVLI